MLVFAFPIGILAGLRSLTPLAVTSWAAHLGWLNLDGTWLSFLGAPITPWIATILALGELLTDKLPNTPSRKVPMAFGARIVTGGLCGAALAGPGFVGFLLGAIGAVIGTFGGAALRARLAQVFGKDLPAASLEDLIAVGGSILIVSRLS